MDQDPPVARDTANDKKLSEHILHLCDKLRGIAGELARDGDTQVAAARAGEALGVDDHVLSAIAVSIYRARQRRYKYFTAELFGEPAWDILLELFVQKIAAVKLTTSGISTASGAPSTTALRTLEKIERQGLVLRYPDPHDRRVTIVELTDLGFKLVRSYLSEGILRDEMPLPDNYRAR